MTVKEGQRYLEMSRSGFVKWRKRHGIAKVQTPDGQRLVRAEVKRAKLGYPVETPTPPVAAGSGPHWKPGDPKPKPDDLYSEAGKAWLKEERHRTEARNRRQLRRHGILPPK